MVCMKHRHHKIPLHAGGTDDPDNIELLTVEEHANAHKILFEKYGRWQDEVAWKGLSGIIPTEECIYRSMRESKIGNTWNIGVPKSEEHKRKLAKSKMGKRNPNFGKPISEECKKKLSIALLGEKNPMYGVKRKEIALLANKASLKKLICPHCGISSSMGNAKRWHFDNCGRK